MTTVSVYQRALFLSAVVLAAPVFAKNPVGLHPGHVNDILGTNAKDILGTNKITLGHADDILGTNAKDILGTNDIIGTNKHDIIGTNKITGHADDILGTNAKDILGTNDIIGTNKHDIIGTNKAQVVPAVSAAAATASVQSSTAPIKDAHCALETTGLVNSCKAL